MHLLYVSYINFHLNYPFQLFSITSSVISWQSRLHFTISINKSKKTVRSEGCYTLLSNHDKRRCQKWHCWRIPNCQLLILQQRHFQQLLLSCTTWQLMLISAVFALGRCGRASWNILRHHLSKDVLSDFVSISSSVRYLTNVLLGWRLTQSCGCFMFSSNVHFQNIYCNPLNLPVMSINPIQGTLYSFLLHLILNLYSFPWPTPQMFTIPTGPLLSAWKWHGNYIAWNNFRSAWLYMSGMHCIYHFYPVPTQRTPSLCKKEGSRSYIHSLSTFASHCWCNYRACAFLRKFISKLFCWVHGLSRSLFSSFRLSNISTSTL